MKYQVALLASAIRVFFALATRTFFQPDEYFQSLEVAHHVVFGYGRLTWEWLSPNPIRGAFYPLLNAPIYGVLKLFGLDGTRLLIWAPKVLHGVLAAGTDIGVYNLANNLLGKRYANVALFVSLTSFFHGFALSRSLSNSLETSFTALALGYFPWREQDTTDHFGKWRTHQRLSIFYAVLACVVRPTSAIIWVFLFPTLLWRQRHSSVRYDLYIDLLAIVYMCGALVFAIDLNYYSQPVLTPLNFLRTNLSSVSHFYGTSPCHYYLSQAIPILCTTSLPFVIHGASQFAGSSGTPEMRLILQLIAWVTSIYSLASHKEWRFLHPVLPIFHLLATKSLVSLYDKSKKAVSTTKDAEPKNELQDGKLAIRKRHILLLLLSAPAIVYVMRYHSRAQIDVMYYLRDLPPSERQSIGFLMPCHSTPWQAYLHDPVLGKSNKLWALGCEPPQPGGDIASYQDQTTVFYTSPAQYLRTRFPQSVDTSFPPSPFPSSVPGSNQAEVQLWKHEWPQNLIIFGSLLEEPGVKDILASKRYELVWFAAGSWEDDSRRRGGVQVWRHHH